MAWPSSLRAGDHAPTDAIRDLGHCDKRAAVVEYADFVSRLDPPRRRIIWMDADCWRTRAFHLRRNVRKHGIDKVMIRGGNQRQRVPACERRVALRRLVRRCVAGQSNESRRRHAFRKKLQLAGWSGYSDRGQRECGTASLAQASERQYRPK